MDKSKEGGVVPLDILSDDGNDLLWYLYQISFPQIKGKFRLDGFASILTPGRGLLEGTMCFVDNSVIGLLKEFNAFTRR